MRKYLKRLGIAGAALIAVGFLAGSVTTVKAAEDNAAAVSRLLSQAKTQAFQLKEDAGELQSLTQAAPSVSSAGKISTQTQAEDINRISADVNAMAEKLAKLQSVRKMAAPWQQMAIDEIKPLVTELVSSTTAVIEYINKNPTRLNTADYKDYVEANSDNADQLAALIGAFVDYGKAKERLQRLGDKLGLERIRARNEH